MHEFKRIMRILVDQNNWRSFRLDGDKYFQENLYTEEEKDIVLRTIARLMPGEDGEKITEKIIQTEKDSLMHTVIKTANKGSRDERDIAKKVRDAYAKNILSISNIQNILSKIKKKNGHLHNDLIWFISETSIANRT